MTILRVDEIPLHHRAFVVVPTFKGRMRDEMRRDGHVILRVRKLRKSPCGLGNLYEVLSFTLEPCRPRIST
jgi:hypothetical protein